MKLPIFLSMSVLILISYSLYSNDLDIGNIEFERYSIDEGLANLVIYDIEQDHHGFIWVSTGDGISRFDGYQFKNYLSDKNDPNSIGSGPAPHIFIDSKDRMWIASISSGLYLYNEDEDNFKKFIHNPEDKNSISSNNLYSIAEDHNGSIWISTIDKGLNKLIEGDKFIHYTQDPNNRNSVSSDKILGILVDSKIQYQVTISTVLQKIIMIYGYQLLMEDLTDII